MMSRTLLLLVAILTFTATTTAQPGPDHWRFNALEFCLYESFKTDVAFVGHVVSVEAFPNPFVTGRPPHWFKVVAKAETVLKGEVQEEQEIYLQRGTASESSIRDKNFVFLANNIDRDSFKGLFAERFSFPIGDTKSDRWTRGLKIIEEIFNGVAQPRVVGTVTERPWDGRWIHYGYDRNRKMAGITVIAEGAHGYQFTTQTDEAGRFQFEKLPLGPKPRADHFYFEQEPDLAQLTEGTYFFSLVLPKKMDITVFNLLDNGKVPHIQVGNALCSATLNMVVEETGTVKGKIVRDSGIWQSLRPQLRLYRAELETKRIFFNDNYFFPANLSMPEANAGGIISFTFEHIPVGPYVFEISGVEIDGEALTIYYPVVKRPEEAAIVNVIANKSTEIEIKLP